MDIGDHMREYDCIADVVKTNIENAEKYFEERIAHDPYASERFKLFSEKFLVTRYNLDTLRKDFPEAIAWASDIVSDYQMWEAKKFPNKKSRSVDPATRALFDRAKEVDADYLDMNSGYIYKIQEYNRAKRFGLPTVVPGIRVFTLEGEYVGYVEDPDMIN